MKRKSIIILIIAISVIILGALFLIGALRQTTGGGICGHVPFQVYNSTNTANSESGAKNILSEYFTSRNFDLIENDIKIVKTKNNDFSVIYHFCGNRSAESNIMTGNTEEVSVSQFSQEQAKAIYCGDLSFIVRNNQLMSQIPVPC